MAKTEGPPLDHADNPFWRFSLAVYGAPRVAAECLALQRELGVDVNLLLFCAWLGTSGKPVNTADIARLDALVRAWRDGVIRPLRALRDALKAEPDPTRQAVRARILEAELAAERVEQDILFAAAADAGSGAAEGTRLIGANVEAYLRWLRTDETPARLPEALIAASVRFGDPN